MANDATLLLPFNVGLGALKKSSSMKSNESTLSTYFLAFHGCDRLSIPALNSDDETLHILLLLWLSRSWCISPIRSDDKIP